MAVNKELHSNKLIEKMKEDNFDVTYHVVKDREYCDITPEDVALFEQYSIAALN